MDSIKVPRNSNIEILRCILMIFIVFYHLLVHGTNGTFNQFFEWQPLQTTKFEALFLLLATFPVDCFMIISGYYGINILKNEKINIEKISKIYIPIFFYSVLFASIALITHRIRIINYLYSFIPIIQSNYWFASCYFVVLLLSPILNYVFEQYKDKKIFITGFVIIGIMNYLLTGSQFAELMGMSYNKLFMIVYCYFVGRFLKTYEAKINISKINCLLLFFGSLIFEYVLGLLSIKFVSKFIWVHLSLNSSPFTILQATMVFLFFKNLKCFSNKACNLIGSASFAVYLIHENSNIRKPLYSIINGGGYKDTVYLIPYLILCALIVFVVCIIIEIVRIYLFRVFKLLFMRGKEKS